MFLNSWNIQTNLSRSTLIFDKAYLSFNPCGIPFLLCLTNGYQKFLQPKEKAERAEKDRNHRKSPNNNKEEKTRLCKKIIGFVFGAKKEGSFSICTILSPNVLTEPFR